MEAFISVKAGFLYCLLKNIKAEIDRKEVFSPNFRLLRSVERELKGEMTMIRKRKNKSITAGESITRPTRAVLVAALSVVIAVGLGVTAETQAATITVNEDGSGDFTDIPAALAAAASGDTIAVAEGTYTGVEIFKAAVKIHGQGTGTRITTGAGSYNDGLVIYGDDVEIGNVAIEVDGFWGAAGVSIAAANATVRGVEVTVGADQYGILVLPIAGLLPEKPRIEGNTITTKAGDLGRSGIECYDSPDPVVTGNNISAVCKNNAILIIDSANAAITRNTISGTYKDTIGLDKSPYSNVTDNMISGVAKGGIRVRESNFVGVEGNTFSGSCTDAIWLDESPYSNVTDNMISVVAKERGIRVTKSNFVGVEGNTFSGSCKGAIQLVKSSDSDVTGNTISGSGRVAIDLGESPYSNVTDNMISGLGEQRAIFVNKSSNFVGVEGNTIKNIRTRIDWAAPIIVEISSDCTVTRNTLIDVYDPDNYANGNGPIAGIRISGFGTWEIPCANNTILQNDYSQSGLPGFVEYVDGELVETGGPGCLLLESGWWWEKVGGVWQWMYGESVDNHAIESLSPTGNTFPLGTNLCTQLLDMTDDPDTPEYDGRSHVSGYAACVHNPNWGRILRHLQETLPKSSGEEAEVEEEEDDDEPLAPPPARQQ